jgi:hypothetical protein
MGSTYRRHGEKKLFAVLIGKPKERLGEKRKMII